MILPKWNRQMQYGSTRTFLNTSTNLVLGVRSQPPVLKNQRILSNAPVKKLGFHEGQGTNRNKVTGALRIFLLRL